MSITAPLPAPPKPPTLRLLELRQADAWERLCDAKIQDHEVLTVTQKIERRRLDALQSIQQASQHMVDADTLACLQQAARALEEQGKLVAELDQLERQDVVQHEQDGDRLRIQDGELAQARRALAKAGFAGPAWRPGEVL